MTSHAISEQGRIDFDLVCTDRMEQLAKLLDAAKARVGPLGDSPFDETLSFSAAELGSVPADHPSSLTVPVLLAGGRRVALGSKGRPLGLDRTVEHGELITG